MPALITFNLPKPKYFKNKCVVLSASNFEELADQLTVHLGFNVNYMEIDGRNAVLYLGDQPACCQVNFEIDLITTEVSV